MKSNEKHHRQDTLRDGIRRKKNTTIMEHNAIRTYEIIDACIANIVEARQCQQNVPANDNSKKEVWSGTTTIRN